MKPLGRKNYGSIPHLSSSKLGPGDHYIEKGQERILTEKVRDRHDVVYAFEKYDGSNVGVCKANGKIFAITRAGYEAMTSPYDQHHLFGKWVYARADIFQDILKEGERICGEWMAMAHGIQYDIIGDPIAFFDLIDNKNTRLPRELFLERISGFGIKSARLLHKGTAIPVDDLMEPLNQRTSDIKSIDLPEGIVFRVERKGVVDFLAKWTRPDFEPGKYMIEKQKHELIWHI